MGLQGYEWRAANFMNYGLQELLWIMGCKLLMGPQTFINYELQILMGPRTFMNYWLQIVLGPQLLWIMDCNYLWVHKYLRIMGGKC